MYVFSGLPETAPKAMQGVAVCMNAEMQRAWRAAGQFCRYEGGRLLHVKLLLHVRVVNVVAVYAPTFNTEAAEKDAFYDKLQEILDTVRSGEEVFVMGDFNARVGTTTHSALSGSATVHASDAIGPFGLGHLNDSGFGVSLRPSVMKDTRVPRLQIGRLTGSGWPNQHKTAG